MQGILVEADPAVTMDWLETEFELTTQPAIFIAPLP
jgi:hypothetical protein